MNRFIATKLALIFLITSLVSWAPIVEANYNKESCENGECVPQLVDQLNDLSSVYKDQCLPTGIKEKDIEFYYLENGLTEPCWKYLTEINHLESELLIHQTKLESKVSCDSGNCNINSPSDNINSQINKLAKVENNLSCSDSKKSQVKSQCSADLSCVLAGSAPLVGGYLAELLVPSKGNSKNCSLKDDNCMLQMAAGFAKAAFTFFEGAWGLLKIVGKHSKKKMKQFWNWVRGAEDHSSTSQLAMAKASEDDNIFKMLLKDFPGTMKKIWEAFVMSMKEWLKAGVFCQKWSGVPLFSECLTPTNSLDCLSCKTVVTGLCSVSGTLLAEVLPAFFTGGLLTATKYGAKGASKISKLFKVSDKGMDAVRSSRLGKMAVKSSDELDDVIKLSKGLKATKLAMQASLKAIQKYLMSPTRKLLKKTYKVLNKNIKTAGLFLAETPTGKVLVFSAKTVKFAARVVLYPVDNHLTVFAYKSGARSFDKVFKLGIPTLGNKTLITSSAVQVNADIERTLIKLEKTRMASSPDIEEIIKLEQELLQQIRPHRREILRSVLGRKETDLEDIIRHLYPELQYDGLAKTMPKEKLLQVERDLYLEIQRMPEGSLKQEMLQKYKTHTSHGVQRTRILGDERTPFEDPIPVEKKYPQDNFSKPASPKKTIVKKSINNYSEASHRELLEKAAQTEQKLKNSIKPQVYDVVAIGAGPNNGVAISVLKETNPNLNVLVIESTESMGTFNKMKGFDVSTPEYIGKSGNNFPGSPLQLRDFNVTDASFAAAEDVGNLTIATYKSADADMLFNNKVIKWTKEPKPGAWPGKYKVETSNGISVYTNSGLAGTGLGNPVIKVKDPLTLKLIGKHSEEFKKTNLKLNHAYAPKTLTVNEFISIASDDVKAGREAMLRYQGKKVLVVGSGDSGKIAVETTSGLNKTLNPKNIENNIETIWLGQKATNGKQFLKNLDSDKKLRYGRIAEAMDKEKIKTVNGYFSHFEEFVNEAGETQFKVFYTSKDGKHLNNTLTVDHVVFGTGYTKSDSGLNSIFSKAQKKTQIGKDVSFRPVSGQIDDFTNYEQLKGKTQISSQLVINGKSEDVYALGVSSNINATDKEFKTAVGGLLDITNPKSAATGEMLANKLTHQKPLKKEVHKILISANNKTVKIIKQPRRPFKSLPKLPNVHVAEVHTKIELSKTLRNFKSSPNSSFTMSVRQGPNGSYEYRVTGLSKKAANDLTRSLAVNSELTYGIDRQFSLGRTILNIEVKTRSSGTISMENLILNPQTVTIKNPISVPMNITGGANRFVSPSLRGIEHSENRKK